MTEGISTHERHAQTASAVQTPASTHASAPAKPACQAPIDSNRTATLQLPSGSCDAHCHIFGPFDRYPLPDDRSFTPALAPQTALAKLHKRLGIARAVIVQSQGHGFDHAPLLDALHAGGGQYRGVALIRASDDEATLSRYHAAGVRGARFNFLAHLGGRPNLDAIRDVIARIRPLNWHAAIHVAGNDIVDYADFLQSLDIRLVVDHMGRPNLAEGPESPAMQTLLTLLDRGNVWVKVSGSDRLSATGAPFADALPFARRIAAHAPERVLWGSDWPHVNLHGPMPDDVDLTNLIAEIVPDASKRKLMLVDNPAAFFDFPHSPNANAAPVKD